MLAHAAGVSDSVVRNWENEGFPSTKPQFEKIEAYLHVIKVSRAALPRMMEGKAPLPEHILPINGHSVTPGKSVAEFLKDHPPADDPMENTVEIKSAGIAELPLFRFTPANRVGGASEDFYAASRGPDDSMVGPAPSDWCCVIELAGNCMNPIYPDGCRVLIDFRAVDNSNGLIPGACYLIQLRGEGAGRQTFKRFVRQDGEEFVFDCINKAQYPKELRIAPPFNAGIAPGWKKLKGEW